MDSPHQRSDLRIGERRRSDRVGGLDRRGLAAAGADLPFSWLFTTREAAGVPLADIAQRTRIPLHLLEGLERGDFRGWPRGLYAKAYLRAYCAEVGIDCDRVIALVLPRLPGDDELESARTGF